MRHHFCRHSLKVPKKCQKFSDNVEGPNKKRKWISFTRGKVSANLIMSPLCHFSFVFAENKEKFGSWHYLFRLFWWHSRRTLRPRQKALQEEVRWGRSCPLGALSCTGSDEIMEQQTHRWWSRFQLLKLLHNDESYAKGPSERHKFDLQCSAGAKS